MSSHLIPFDYEQAKAGNPVRTRDGGAVKILGLYAQPDRMCFIRVQRQDGSIHHYKKDGKVFRNTESPADLFLVAPIDGSDAIKDELISSAESGNQLKDGVVAMAELLVELSDPEVKWTGNPVEAELSASKIRRNAMIEIADQLQKLAATQK